MRSTTTSAYHHGNLRSALLERAEQTIESAGVEALSLRQLARDLGVSHGAPGRHFRDRQALLDALAYAGFVSMNERMATAAAEAGSVRDRLDAVAQAYIGFALEHGALLSLMYTTKHGPTASAVLREIGQGSLNSAIRLIEEGQADGSVAAGDAEMLARVAFASVHGVAVLAADDLLDGLPVPLVTRATVRMLWAGLTAGASGEATGAGASGGIAAGTNTPGAGPRSGAGTSARDPRQSHADVRRRASGAEGGDE